MPLCNCLWRNAGAHGMHFEAEFIVHITYCVSI